MHNHTICDATINPLSTTPRIYDISTGYPHTLALDKHLEGYAHFSQHKEVKTANKLRDSQQSNG